MHVFYRIILFLKEITTSPLPPKNQLEGKTPPKSIWHSSFLRENANGCECYIPH